MLVTDALSYSATDMFAAGFQDHGIGPVIGVGGATGAGGANVWSHGLLCALMQPDEVDDGPSPFTPLPHGADLRVAVRRTTRVGPQAGNVLEDLGVTPEVSYRMTRRDVLEGNQDLIDTAIDQLAARRPYAIRVGKVTQHRDRAPTVVVATRNITRVDAEVDGRRLRTHDVKRNRVTLELDDVIGDRRTGEVALRLEGYDGTAQVAALRTTIQRRARHVANSRETAPVQEALDDLVTLLALEPIEVNIFRGRSPDENRQRVFGGQVAGQALVAAARTVDDSARLVHSLHAYFLRPGDPTVPILYEVDRLRDGRSFSTRRVVAIQHGRAIFNLQASFHGEEDGPDHQMTMPPGMPDPGVAARLALAHGAVQGPARRALRPAPPDRPALRRR